MTLTGQRTTEDGRQELLVTISPECFAEEVEREYKRQKSKITLPGFRKGKAPRNMIERMYGEDFFFDDALNSMVQDVYMFALKESAVDVIDQPRVTIDEYNKENGVKLIFSVMLRPELKVKKYKGLKASKHIHPVEEQDINNELESMRDRNSRLVTIEDRAAELDDTTVIDFEGFVDDVAFDGGKGDDFSLTLGSGQFIPGFEEQIVGHKTGEEFDITVKFPDDYNAENLAGKESVFKIKLKEIRRKELPELDDEFAKDVSEFDTLDELKEDIKNRIEKDRDTEADAGVENQLGDLLADELEGDVPEVMIESRIDELVRDFSYRMSAQGLQLEQYLQYTGQDMDSFREGFKENAEKQVKVRLALEAVVRAEKISVLDEDVEAEYAKMVEGYQMEVEKVKEFIPELDLRKDLEANKALDFVKENAKITEDKHSAHVHEHEHEGHDHE